MNRKKGTVPFLVPASGKRGLSPFFPSTASPLLARVIRNTTLVCLLAAGVALVAMPSRPRFGLGIIGGGVLAGVAFWALSSAVSGALRGAREGQESGEFRPISRGFALVKFFTRHAILAFVAYVMMVRLGLDPVAMFVGVTSVVVAIAIEAARPR